MPIFPGMVRRPKSSTRRPAMRRGPLGDRACLMADLERAGAAAGDGRLALLLAIDVDDFRAFNAEHGHAAGDEHLDLLTRRLLDLVPGRAYRLGGDAFAVLLEGSAGRVGGRRARAARARAGPRAGGAALLVRRRRR